MSEFEDIFHLVHQNSQKSKKFLEDTFARLDAWKQHADETQQQLAFAYTQAHPPCATIAMWWFEQEKKQPQVWANSWSAQWFLQHISKEGLIDIAPERVLERIDWALQRNDWGFFDSWDMHFIRENVPRLCCADLNSPVVAKILKEIDARNVGVFEEMRNEIPTQYIQLHTSIIPDGVCLVHQRNIIAMLGTDNPLNVLTCLEQYTGAPALGKPQVKLEMCLREWWGGNNQHTDKYDQDVLEKICNCLVNLFPNHPDTVVPRLDGNYFERWNNNHCERWKIQANMCRPLHLQWFVAGETEKMLRSLAMSSNCDMNAWVEFWKDIFSINNWTQEMSNAGDRTYDFRKPYPLALDRNTIKNNMAPHWDFFEHNAPKIGRALAGVVAFYGGNPPLSLCDFSHVFNLKNNPPVGFPQFIEEQIEQQALIAEAHAQRQILSDCIDASVVRTAPRKM